MSLRYTILRPGSRRLLLWPSLRDQNPSHEMKTSIGLSLSNLSSFVFEAVVALEAGSRDSPSSDTDGGLD